MGIDSVQDYNIMTYGEKHYLGKKAEEAKAEGRSIFRDFKKVDKNKDELISFDEIVVQRENASRKKRRCGNVFLALSAYYSINGIQMSRQSKELQEIGCSLASDLLGTKITPKSSKRMNLITTLFFLAIGTAKYFKSKKIDKETQEYANSYYKC